MGLYYLALAFLLLSMLLDGPIIILPIVISGALFIGFLRAFVKWVWALLGKDREIEEFEEEH